MSECVLKANSSTHIYTLLQGPVKQVRGPGHNVSCGAPALVLHENMRNRPTHRRIQDFVGGGALAPLDPRLTIVLP